MVPILELPRDEYQENSLQLAKTAPSNRQDNWLNTVCFLPWSSRYLYSALSLRLRVIIDLIGMNARISTTLSD